MNIFDVCKHFKDTTDYRDNRTYQSLCFIAQGIHLALNHEELFPEDFEAWIIGPANPELYEVLKESRLKSKITDQDFNDQELRSLKEAIRYIDDISEYNIPRLLKQYASYKARRAGLNMDEPSTETIPKEKIFTDFVEGVISTVNCPICDAETKITISTENSLNMSKCSSCGNDLIMLADERIFTDQCVKPSRKDD
jgi:uncharacterized phage-associated protein/Zn ribbon nucleic-acid-binding protein